MRIPFGKFNENPLVRALRVLGVAMALGAVAAGLQAVSVIDWPGQADAVFVAGGTAMFVWLDKKLRGAA